MQQKSNQWSEKLSVQLFFEFQTAIVFRLSFLTSDYKNDVTEIQLMFGLIFFQTSDLTFVASEIKIPALQ